MSLFYLLAQMAGAGALIALLLQIPNSNTVGQGIVIAVVGLLMIVYVLVGGMKGTTWVQVIKAGLLLVGADGTVVAANQALLGWTGRDAVEPGLRLDDLLAVGSRIYWQTHVAPMLHVDGRVDEVELERRTAGVAG